MSKLQARIRKEKGSVLVLIAAGLVALMGASALSVDVGFFFIMRNQLQNTVDAATLAGAEGLIADPGNFSSSGQAETLATQVAAQNYAGGQPVNLSANEITFPNGDTIRITVTRPSPTFFSRVLGVQSVNITVTAAAVAAPVNGVGGGPSGGGMRPFSVLDQFGHGGVCVPPNDAVVNNPPHGAFNSSPHTWKGVKVNSDFYKSPYDSQFDGWDLSRESDCSNVTGFIAPRDVNGTQITLKQFGGSTPWITPGNYGPVALGGTGGSNYDNNIMYGYNNLVSVGDILSTETGVINGPTIDGVQYLTNLDPSARMVKGAGGWSVVSNTYPLNESPRIVPLPMYSVNWYPGNGHSNFQVASIASFFIQGTDGKNVWGQFVQSRAKNGAAAKPATNGGSTAVGGGGRMVATVRLIP